jgi:RNA polymerase sigma-70 factor, ECF subfamily
MTPDTTPLPARSKDRLSRPSTQVEARGRVGTQAVIPDRLTFEEFYEARYEELVRLLALVSGTTDEAEDVAQEAMVIVLARWDRVQSMHSPGGYLYKVALNARRRRWRRAAKGVPAADGTRAEIATPDVALDVVDAAEIRRVLLTLSEHLREALVLSAWLGLPTADVARLQGISEGAARVRIHRARSSFKERFDP